MADADLQSKRPKKGRLLKRVIIALLITMLLGGGWLWYYYKTTYPYGWSHCCTIGMMFALNQYADAHGGHYPSGGATPEASLSKLYHEMLIDPQTLAGMSVDREKAENILKSGDVLGPDTCGWHYVEGLTKSDDSGIAILYSKEALGHNGQKLADGGREVIFLGGLREYVSRKDWPKFLEEQAVLLEKRKK